MLLAPVTAEALAALLAIEAGMADWLSGCTDGRRVIASTVLALLLLAAWAVMWKSGVPDGDESEEDEEPLSPPPQS